MKRYFGTTLFSELRPGFLSLGVPIVDGAVQIGTETVKGKEKARLTVKVEPGEIDIRREDGSDLMIDLVSYDGPSREQRSSVLAQPIAGLTLCECIETGEWKVINEPELIPRDPEGLLRFLICVAEFAVERQRTETAQVGFGRAMAELITT